MIQIGPITKCYVCGEEPNTMEHECAWSENLIHKIGDIPLLNELKDHMKTLILDAYHRGFKDGGKGLTLNQTLNLQNAFTQLGHIRSEIRELLSPEKPE